MADNATQALGHGIQITPVFAAPEILEASQGKRLEVNCLKSDIYSFGITLLRCCGISWYHLECLHAAAKS